MRRFTNPPRLFEQVIASNDFLACFHRSNKLCFRLIEWLNYSSTMKLPNSFFSHCVIPIVLIQFSLKLGQFLLSLFLVKLANKGSVTTERYYTTFHQKVSIPFFCASNEETFQCRQMISSLLHRPYISRLKCFDTITVKCNKNPESNNQ